MISLGDHHIFSLSLLPSKLPNNYVLFLTICVKDIPTKESHSHSPPAQLCCRLAHGGKRPDWSLLLSFGAECFIKSRFPKHFQIWTHIKTLCFILLGQGWWKHIKTQQKKGMAYFRLRIRAVAHWSDYGPSFKRKFNIIYYINAKKHISALPIFLSIFALVCSNRLVWSICFWLKCMWTATESICIPPEYNRPLHSWYKK